MGNLESYGVDLVEEIKEGLKNLKKEVIKKEMAEIELMMKSAEENHNTSKIQELMVKFKELSQELIS
jgi:peroxiredoxin family protein